MRKRAICHNYFRIKIFVEKKTNFFLNISVTNEISEYPSYVDQLTNILDNSVCVVCKYVMQSIAKEIGNNKTRNGIEKVVRGVCNHLRTTAAKYCFEFVDNYVDAIINMISEVVSTPKESCARLGYCEMPIAV